MLRKSLYWKVQWMSLGVQGKVQRKFDRWLIEVAVVGVSNWISNSGLPMWTLFHIHYNDEEGVWLSSWRLPVILYPVPQPHQMCIANWSMFGAHHVACCLFKLWPNTINFWLCYVLVQVPDASPTNSSSLHTFLVAFESLILMYPGWKLECWWG